MIKGEIKRMILYEQINELYKEWNYYGMHVDRSFKIQFVDI